jgi:uncharacterized Zn ribbon protein
MGAYGISEERYYFFYSRMYDSLPRCNREWYHKKIAMLQDELEAMKDKNGNFSIAALDVLDELTETVIRFEIYDFFVVC